MTSTDTSAEPRSPRPATRKTWQRAAIREQLDSTQEFRTVQQVHEALAKDGARVGLATVYRAADHGRVRRGGARCATTTARWSTAPVPPAIITTWCAPSAATPSRSPPPSSRAGPPRWEANTASRRSATRWSCTASAPTAPDPSDPLPEARLTPRSEAQGPPTLRTPRREATPTHAPRGGTPPHAL